MVRPQKCLPAKNKEKGLNWSFFSPGLIFHFLFLYCYQKNDLIGVLRFLHCKWTLNAKHVKVRSGENIGIWPLTSKKTKPSKESAIHIHLLNCNNIPPFEEFTILTKRNNKFVFEIKESLLTKRDRLILNKNISSAKLFLFDNS